MKKNPIRLRAILTFAAPPRRPRFKPHPAPLDLFGQIAVTEDDVRAWLIAVPRLDPDGPRAAYYVAAYNVVCKIIAAKRRGEFAALVSANDA